MNADRRLDQLEPVISELLVKQDKLSALMLDISQVLNQQSDNVSFSLKNQLQMSSQIEKIEMRLDKMDDRFDKMDGRFDKMEDKFDEMAETQKSILSILLSK